MVDSFAKGDIGHFDVHSLSVKSTKKGLFGKEPKEPSYSIFINDVEYVVFNKGFDSQEQIYKKLLNHGKIFVEYHPPTGDSSEKCHMEIIYFRNKKYLKYHVM